MCSLAYELLVANAGSVALELQVSVRMGMQARHAQKGHRDCELQEAGRATISLGDVPVADDR